MSKWWLLLMAWLVALVQSYFLSALSGGRLIPNLVLVLLFYVAINRPLRLAIVLAVWAGLWLDLAAGQLGPRIVLYVALVLLIELLARRGLEMKRRSTQYGLLLLASLVYNGCLLLVMWVSLRQLHWQPLLLVWWSLEAAVLPAIAWLFSRRLQLVIAGTH